MTTLMILCTLLFGCVGVALCHNDENNVRQQQWEAMGFRIARPNSKRPIIGHKRVSVRQDLATDVADFNFISAHRTSDELKWEETETKRGLGLKELVPILLGRALPEGKSPELVWFKWVRSLGIEVATQYQKTIWMAFQLPVVQVTRKFFDLVVEDAPVRKERNPSVALATKELKCLTSTLKWTNSIQSWFKHMEVLSLRLGIETLRLLDLQDEIQEKALEMVNNEPLDLLELGDTWDEEDWQQALMEEGFHHEKEWNCRLTPLSRGGWIDTYLDHEAIEELRGQPQHIVCKAILAAIGEFLGRQEIEGTSTHQWGYLQDRSLGKVQYPKEAMSIIGKKRMEARMIAKKPIGNMAKKSALLRIAMDCRKGCRKEAYEALKELDKRQAKLGWTFVRKVAPRHLEKLATSIEKFANSL